MVKCNGCRYLDGYEEYGMETIYCKHPVASREMDDPDLNYIDTEKERICMHHCSIYQTEPHEYDMGIFARMLERLEKTGILKTP